MNRQRTQRYLSVFGQAAVATALALSLSCASSGKKQPAAAGAGTPAAAQKPASANGNGKAEARKAEELLRSARRETRAGKYAVARELIKQAETVDPRNTGIPRAKDELAKAEAQGAAKANDARISDLSSAARKKVDAKDFDGASRDVKEILALDPKNRSAQDIQKRIDDGQRAARASANQDAIGGHLKSAGDNLKAKKFDAARADVNKVLALDKGNRDASNLLRRIDADQKAFDADRTVREADSRVAEARKLASAGKHEEAIAQYKEAQRLDPKSRDAQNGIRDAERAMKAKADAARKAADAEAKKQAAAEKAKAEAAKKDAPKAAAPKKDAPKADAPKVEPAKKPEPAKSSTVKADTPKVEPAKAAPAVDRKDFDAAIRQGDDAMKRGAYGDAIAAYQLAAQTQPTLAEEANKKIEAANGKQAQELEKQAEAAKRENRRAAELAHDEGVTLYKRGDLERARDRWREAKRLSPDYTAPDEYLESTEKEFNTLVAKREAQRLFEEAEAAAQEKMNTLISIATTTPTPLADFLNNLKLLSGMDFALIGGIETRVEGSFEDKPLSVVLDSILLPIGLRWDRRPGEDIVLIRADLRTQVFNATPDQLAAVQSLVEDGTVGRMLYGSRGVPILEGQEVTTDERQNLIVITDSEMNISKFIQFLNAVKDAGPQDLIFKSYTIQGDKAPQIKALLEALLSSDDDAPFARNRKVIVDGNTLIVKDTAENIRRAETLLMDRNFMGQIYSDKLHVASFNLTPVIDFEDNPELARSFGETVKDVVETLLYSQEGLTKANREGRRLWWDPATLQLIITDYPDNIEAVTRLIESLPQFRTKRRSKIYFLEWATAADLAGTVLEFLGQGQSSTTETVATGNEVTKTLRVTGELQFRTANFRVTRVNENDVADENDDDVELVVRTGTTTQDLTIREFRSEFVEDYEVVAEDVKPSATPGEGRARLRIRFTPGGRSGGGAEVPEEEVQAQPAEPTGPQGVQIVEIPNLNALFVQYDTIDELNEVDFWIRTLDIPTLQVSMEIRFVEVFESKARELKADFIISDLTQGFDFSDAVINNRFAQNTDEVNNIFEPGSEQQERANLLKGGVNFAMRFLNGGSPIEFNLRALEAAGVINITNAPSVTVLNGEEAEFIIERQLGIRQPVQGGTGDTAQFTAVASERPVELSLTPTITQAGNITMEVDTVIEDRETHIGQRNVIAAEDGSTTGIPRGVYIADQGYAVLRKELQTRARIRDGGTVVLGGWVSARDEDLNSGVPLLRDIPFIGKLLFNREQKTNERVTLSIFLTGNVLRD